MCVSRLFKILHQQHYYNPSFNITNHRDDDDQLSFFYSRNDVKPAYLATAKVTAVAERHWICIATRWIPKWV